jgi:hypothetical protein
MSEMKLNGTITFGSWEIKADDEKYIIERDGDFHGIFRSLESAIEELKDQQSYEATITDANRSVIDAEEEMIEEAEKFVEYF